MLVGIDASRAMRTPRTGTENYAYRLIQHLLRLDTTNPYRLYVQQPPPAGLFDCRAECRVIGVPRLWTHVGLSLEMLQRAPDVLFVPAHVLPLVHPRRCVVTIHDLGHRYFPEAHTASQRAYLEWSTRFAVRHASRLIAVSQATKADLVKLYSADERRVVVVHHGVAKNPKSQIPTSNLQSLISKFDLPPRYVIAIGTVQPRKNYARLIEAFASLRLLRDEVGLVIVGKLGWQAEAIVARAKEAGAILAGHVSDTEKYALLKNATLFALPSLYEGFGMPILEAQAAGMPVITSNTSACPEVAGDSAWLVDPHDTHAIADAMRGLLEDEPLRQTFIQKGFANVARFSWEKCARETLDVLLQA